VSQDYISSIEPEAVNFGISAHYTTAGLRRISTTKSSYCYTRQKKKIKLQKKFFSHLNRHHRRQNVQKSGHHGNRDHGDDSCDGGGHHDDLRTLQGGRGGWVALGNLPHPQRLLLPLLLLLDLARIAAKQTR
jgi:hypothetical protein